ncbi:hypothetical protein, partial [Cellulosimicrobium cellulans]|uniref:hypothetical protein n=1 Tax=Cellulosimicrobium cellulans TaxID=1710 RepID=UPI001112EC74
MGADWQNSPTTPGAGTIVRLEQLYPLDVEGIRAEIAKYGDADVVWVQDEPENQGAWS